MFKFVVEYPHLVRQSGQPRMWTASIWAYDEADAELRIRAIRDHGAIVGQLVEDGAW